MPAGAAGIADHAWSIEELVGILEARENAKLMDAGLMDANLRRTILKGNLAGARFGHTGISDVDLSEAMGIEGVEHWIASPVSTSTLERTARGLARNPSRQGAVEKFLRGAGLQEHTIAFFRSLIGKPVEFYSCFISYSHADKTFARRLHDGLQARGIRCWLDEHQVLPVLPTPYNSWGFIVR